jgi:mannose-1-phosphate guanylyltransferase
MSLLEDDTPFQDTLERVSADDFLPPLLITSQNLAETIDDQCDDISFIYEDLLLEPQPHHTAAACLTAALWAFMRGEGEIPLLILPSDHFIADQTAFMRAVHDALHTANQGYLVAFGVVADRCSSAHSYIQVGTRLDTRYTGHNVVQFVERPSLDGAQKLLDQRCFVWNTGIYCATPKTLIAEMQRLCPSLITPCEKALELAKETSLGHILDHESFSQCQKLSFEKAIMEKTDKSCVVSLLSAWSDFGTWPGLWKALNY